MNFFSLFAKSNTIYFPGCTTYYKFNDIYELYKKIFSKLSIKYKILDKKICCGLPCIEGGYENEARKFARKNFEFFKKNNIKELITNSPCCYKMFTHDYPTLIPEWDIKIINIWKLIYDKLYEKPFLIKNKYSKEIVYIDNCYLGRYCEIYEEPRKILELLGYKIKELYDNHEESLCCGGCGGLMKTNSELANKIAKEKISQIKRTKINEVVVSSVYDYWILRKNSSNELKIFELAELIALALGIIEENEKKDFYEQIINKEFNENE